MSEERRSYGDDPRGDDLEARLRGVEVPGSPEAGERAWDAVGAAFASRRPVRRRRRRMAPSLAVAVVLGVLMLAVAAGATQPGAAVRGFVVRVLGGDPRARAPGADRPAPARAHAGDLAARSVDRGARRIADAARAVRGRVVVAARAVRRRVERARMSVRSHPTGPCTGRCGRRGASPPPRGRRTATGSPTGGRAAWASWRATGPGRACCRRRWRRPGRPGGRARRTRSPGSTRRATSSSATSTPARSCGARPPALVPRGRCRGRPTGALALVQSTDGLRLADPGANRVSRVRLPSGDRAVAAAWAPRGRRLAVVARGASGDLTRVLVAQGGVRIADRPVFTTTGRLASPAWSPDGSRVLVRWTDADEWLLLPPAGGSPTRSPATPASAPRGRSAGAPGIVAISPVARRFGGVPVVRGWCCA